VREPAREGTEEGRDGGEEGRRESRRDIGRMDWRAVRALGILSWIQILTLTSRLRHS
jgi:hypothetical protein